MRRDHLESRIVVATPYDDARLESERVMSHFRMSRFTCCISTRDERWGAGVEYHYRGGGLGSSTIFKKFNEPYAPS